MGIRRWWQGEEEIDLVGLDESTGKALFVECTWTSLTPTKARGIMSELRRKSRSVRWREDDRNERYCVIARHIDRKEELGDAGPCFLDLADISMQSEMWRKKPSKRGRSTGKSLHQAYSTSFWTRVLDERMKS